MQQLIKVLKDTPFHEEGVVIQSEEFIAFYGQEAQSLLKGDDTYKTFNSWFSVIEDKFQVGDIVWNERMQIPLTIVKDYEAVNYDSCTIDAVRAYPQTYKRKATPEEIETHKFDYFSDRKIKASTKRLLYLDSNNNWVEIENPLSVLTGIIQIYTNRPKMKVTIKGYSPYLVQIASIKIGCQIFSCDSIEAVAKKMGVL